MKPYALRKWFNRQVLAQDVRFKRARFRANPSQLVIEPTNRCNGACPICARHFWDEAENPPTDLEPDTLARLTEFLQTADTVFAFGHGEPTIAPLFWKVVETAKKFGCRVEVTTNGLALTDAMLERFLDTGVDVLNLSLDSLDPATLRQRRGLDPAQAEHILTYLARRRHELGAPSPTTGLAVVIDRNNLAELPALLRFGADLRVQTMLVNHLVAWDVALHSRSAYHDPERLRRTFAELRAAAAQTNVALVLPFEAIENGRCPHPLRMFFVRASGEVWPCCNGVFRNDQYNFPVGNVHFASLRSIWNAEPYRQLRRAFLRGEPLPDHCRICPLFVDELGSHLRQLPAR